MRLVPSYPVLHAPNRTNWTDRHPHQASTLSGAGLTAWNSLRLPALLSSSPSKSKSVLLQGTGGVSLFSLLLALSSPDVTPIISSSSEAKLKSITNLTPKGRIKGYNYRTEPDQALAVHNFTNGRGVDVVVNNTGLASIPADIASL